MNRFELKNEARGKIRGKIGTLFVINLIYLIVVYAVNFIYVTILEHIVSENASISSSAPQLIILGGTEISFAFIYLGIINENRKPAVKDLLIGFEKNNFSRGVFGAIRYFIFGFLWSLLLIVPGIIKMFAYSQMFYLLTENPEMTAKEAQKKSIEMMKGHKGELFILGCSFIPWLLLSLITCGIALIYVGPYVSTTMARYYNYLKGLDSDSIIEVEAEEVTEK